MHHGNFWMEMTCWWNNVKNSRFDDTFLKWVWWVIDGFIVLWVCANFLVLKHFVPQFFFLFLVFHLLYIDYPFLAFWYPSISSQFKIWPLSLKNFPTILSAIKYILWKNLQFNIKTKKLIKIEQSHQNQGEFHKNIIEPLNAVSLSSPQKQTQKIADSLY